jgi:formylglycine-generating enzyme required for sulfatase activity
MRLRVQGMVWYISVMLCLWGQVCWPVALALANPNNPQPAEGDLILLMPHEENMVFRPVFIGKGKNPFFLHHFDMGDPSNDFKEHLTRVGIGGAFLGQQNGQQDWLYYLGKYEVTEAQYAAIMGSAASATPSSRSPIKSISWFEAQEFIHKYNLWLFANARDSLPRCGKTVGFVRLPTEVEWEFAARGAIAATAEQFRARHPYPGALNKYEWFSGPSSSHNKLQPVGGLAPNALSLHDMLGNVAEMTSGLYQVEYYQGRIGGFVARGGHYLTQESNMRASLRAEQPFYDSDRNSQPQRSPTLGIRLAISCAIFTALDTTDVQQYWVEWRGSRTRRESPAGSSTTPPATQANIKLVKVAEVVQQVLGDASLTGDTRRQLEIVQASFGNIETTIKQAEVDQALAWMTMATLRGRYIADALKRLAIFRQSIETAKGSATKAALDTMYENRDRQLKTIETTLHKYAQNLDQLYKLEKEVREQAFTQYLKDLTRAEDADHIKIFSKAVKPHLEQYPKHREGDFAQWKADLEKL